MYSLQITAKKYLLLISVNWMKTKTSNAMATKVDYIIGYKYFIYL